MDDTMTHNTQRAGTANHAVEGLPSEVYTVHERIAAGSPRFFLRMHGRPMMRPDGSHAWYATLEEARQALIDFVGRMQDA